MRRYNYSLVTEVIRQVPPTVLGTFFAFILFRVVWVVAWGFSAWLKGLHPVILVSFVMLQIMFSCLNIGLCLFMLIGQIIVWVVMMFVSDDFGASLRPDTA